MTYDWEDGVLEHDPDGSVWFRSLTHPERARTPFGGSPGVYPTFAAAMLPERSVSRAIQTLQALPDGFDAQVRITFTCPDCRDELIWPDGKIGDQTVCWHCDRAFAPVVDASEIEGAA